MISMLVVDSPLGALRVLGSADAVTGVYTPSYDAAGTCDVPLRQTPVLARAVAQLEEYFAGTRTQFDLPLGASGTEFQMRVWRALTTIPFGTTWSYGQLAHAIGKPTASRAVGAANGKNPLGIIVPCHRVIGASGALTGYAGGMAAKQLLLAHEQRFATRASTQTKLALS